MTPIEIEHHIIEAHRHAEIARAAIGAMAPRHNSVEHTAQIHIAGAVGAAGRAIRAWQQVVRREAR